MNKIGRAAAVAALALGFAVGAFAQVSPGSPGSPDAVGGSTTDMTSAGDANGGGLPQIERQGTIEYVSGGVGLDESTALKREARRWPLAFRFTGPTSDYLADVHVRIVDPRGIEVLSADSMGPYMLVKLPPGRYTVHASYADQEQKRTVNVPARPGTHADFHWGTQ
ncbi:MAG: hypothetical protein QOI13_3091 [Paraburkholderia sp.]|jgi:hypothetical protein|nr:hypothetical protein [Paraburkholderia sp.]